VSSSSSSGIVLARPSVSGSSPGASAAAPLGIGLAEPARERGKREQDRKSTT